MTITRKDFFAAMVLASPVSLEIMESAKRAGETPREAYRVIANTAYILAEAMEDRRDGD